MADDSKEPILVGAREFFEEAQNHEADWREEWHDDLRFRALDQWPEAARAARNVTGEPPRPCMTIDQTDQYVRQVINDARLSPPALRANPVDDKADIKVAEDLQGLFRHIERASRCPRPYLTALDWAVTTGRGVFRVYSEQVNKDRNFFEPRIGRIANALAFYADPYSVEMDGSDQTDAMLIVDYAHSAFRRKWPKHQPAGSWDAAHRNGWLTNDIVRVAEWHSVRERPKTLILTEQGEFTPEEFKEVNLQAMAAGVPLIGFRERETTEKVCTIRQVTSFEVLDEVEFHAPHVGLIPVYGNERYTDDGRKLFGMIRAAKDPQRLTNYLASNMAEAANGQTKAPWLAPIAAIRGFEAEWAKANTSSQAYLPYNTDDGDGNPVQPPTRAAVDLQLMGYANMVTMGHQMLQTAIGMYQASVGAQSNETSGVAIARRKSESDVGTYHYIDNLSDSIQHAGRIIMAMLPKIYDTARVQRIIGEDGEPGHVRIDPAQQQAFSEQPGPDGKKMHVLNPGIGEYDVYVTVGPSYASQREETAATLGDLMGRNPDLMAISGDIYFDNLNFPGAKQMAKRMKAMLPDPVKATEEESEVPPEIAQMIQRVVGVVQQREQVMQEQGAQLAQMSEQAKQDKAQSDIARAQMATERERLAKQAAEVEHARELLRIEQTQAMRDTQRMAADLSKAAELPDPQEFA